MTASHYRPGDPGEATADHTRELTERPWDCLSPGPGIRSVWIPGPPSRKELRMAHPNEEVARSATEALSKGDVEGFLALHTDDVVVHFPGRGPMAGDYRGKDGLGQMFQ